MIPWQANRLKKYRGRCDPLVSKMSHNKEATPPLGDSEMLRVQDPPGEAIPALAKRPEDDFKSQYSVSRQDAGDIFPEDPPGTDAASQSRELQGEVSAGVVKTATVSSDAEALARGSSDQKVNWGEVVTLDFREVTEVPDCWVPVGKHRRRKWRHLGNPDACPSQTFEP